MQIFCSSHRIDYMESKLVLWSPRQMNILSQFYSMNLNNFRSLAYSRDKDFAKEQLHTFEFNLIPGRKT